MRHLITTLALVATTLPLSAQRAEKELADPAPFRAEAWQNVKDISLAWGSTDERYSRSEPPSLAPVKRMTVHGWRGERLSVQAVLTLPTAVKRATLSVSDLVSGKKRIAAGNGPPLA